MIRGETIDTGMYENVIKEGEGGGGGGGGGGDGGSCSSLLCGEMWW